MNAISEFLFSVCTSALIFTVITFILPEEGAGKTARLVAAVFVLTVILKAGASAALSLSKTETGIVDKADEYDRDEYISRISSQAVKKVIEDKLRFAGCSYSEVEVTVAYTEDGFSDLNITVKVNSEEDRAIAENVSREIATEFIIRVE